MTGFFLVINSINDKINYLFVKTLSLYDKILIHIIESGIKKLSHTVIRTADKLKKK